AVYVPHILYNTYNSTSNLDVMRDKYKISEEDFVFIMFGNIRPYKNIEKGINSYKKLQLKNAKLLIAGRPINNEYAKKIVNMCKNEDGIILNLRYLSDAELNAVLDISDVVLMPYKDESSMNSGVMIQSFSKGKTVIVPDICMAKDLKGHDFFYMYRNSLKIAMIEAYQNGKEMNRQMGEKAREYIYKNNNRQIVKNSIYNILKGDL
ncbi:MAG: glycosyltransferase, partial [Lachnospiraceae bacterium]|nr:glycosyltransferase [Lachnospiraceae bacterium]